jgi:hypothetical protein
VVGGGRAGAGDADTEQGVGAEVALVFGAVERDERASMPRWSSMGWPMSAGAMVSLMWPMAVRTPLPR